MRVVVEKALDHFYLFNNNGIFFAFFMVAILYIIITEEDGHDIKIFGGYSVLFCILYFFPVTAHVIMKYCVGELVYWRMFWLLPIGIVIAYAIVKEQGRIQHKVGQVLFFIVMAGVLMLSGTNVYNEDNFMPATNYYNLPDSVIEICDIINVAAENYEEEKKVVVPNEMVSYVRQYDASIKMPYGRRTKVKRNRAYIKECMTSGDYEWDEFADVLRKEDCTYLVLSTNSAHNYDLDRFGFEIVGETVEYAVFHLKIY